MSVFSLQANSRPAFDRVVVRGQLAAEGPVRLLQPQRLDRVVAGVGQAKPVARGDQVLVGADGELGRHVQLPAELADVGDPGGADRGVAEVDRVTSAERERLVAEIGAREPGQQVARPGSHDPVDGVLRGHVDQRGVQARGHPPGDVVLVAFGARGAADQQELLGREPGDGDVGLVGSVRVQHRSVDGPARGDRHVGGAQPLQRPFGVRAGHAGTWRSWSGRTGPPCCGRPAVPRWTRAASSAGPSRTRCPGFRRGARRSWPAPSPSCCRSPRWPA